MSLPLSSHPKHSTVYAIGIGHDRNENFIADDDDDTERWGVTGEPRGVASHDRTRIVSSTRKNQYLPPEAETTEQTTTGGNHQDRTVAVHRGVAVSPGTASPVGFVSEAPGTREIEKNAAIAGGPSPPRGGPCCYQQGVDYIGIARVPPPLTPNEHSRDSSSSNNNSYRAHTIPLDPVVVRPSERRWEHPSPARISPLPRPPSFAVLPSPEANVPRQQHPAMHSNKPEQDPDPAAAPTSSSVGWNHQDDLRLAGLMGIRGGPHHQDHHPQRFWAGIARQHGRGKSAGDCRDRWVCHLRPRIHGEKHHEEQITAKARLPWSPREDSIVVDALRAVAAAAAQPAGPRQPPQTFTGWAQLARYLLPGRSGRQVRDRWINHLDPRLNRNPFDRIDDYLLWEGYQTVGRKWSRISTEYFSSKRSERQLKNRWRSCSFQRFIEEAFGPGAYARVNNAAAHRGRPTHEAGSAEE